MVIVNLFSIHCDLAPEYDLCIDAGIIDCESEREDENCEFDPLDTIDWACHRIVIPSEYVGYIATLEITAADCGEGCHFGYAYIDGICEDCDGSVFGSAFYMIRLLMLRDMVIFMPPATEILFAYAEAMNYHLYVEVGYWIQF